MNKMREKLNEELKNMKLNENFASDIMRTCSQTQKKQKRTHPQFAAAAALVICLLVVGTSVVAEYMTRVKVTVNGGEVSGLEPLERKMVPDIQGLEEVQDEEIMDGIFEKRYPDYESLKEEFQLPFLESEYAKGNEHMQIWYTTDKKHFSRIHVGAYILGDATDFKENPDGKGYGARVGEEFGGPLDLEITLAITDQQEQEGYWSEYSGCIVEEKYVCDQGYTVLVLSSVGKDPAYTLIFTADGIQYKLTGAMSLDNMKKIVDSMH